MWTIIAIITLILFLIAAVICIYLQDRIISKLRHDSESYEDQSVFWERMYKHEREMSEKWRQKWFDLSNKQFEELNTKGGN